MRESRSVFVFPLPGSQERIVSPHVVVVVLAAPTHKTMLPFLKSTTENKQASQRTCIFTQNSWGLLCFLSTHRMDPDCHPLLTSLLLDVSI